MALVRGKKRAADSGDETEASANRGFETLTAELWNAEAGVRRAAVRGLASFPGIGMLLCDRLEVETSPSVRSVIMTGLTSIGTPEVAARLTDHLHSEDAQLRNAAIEALQEMPDAVVPLLERLLADEDSDVRIFAVNIVAVLRHQQAPEWLARVIRSDPHINVCTAALDGLVEVGAAGMISDVEQLVARFPESPFMRFAADTAIRRIRDA
jgi:HEAT repeat protein